MKKTLKKAKAQPSRLSVLIATLSAYFQRSPAALTMLLAASGVFTGDMMCNVADGTPLDGSSLLLLIFLAGFEGLAIMIHAHEHPAHVKVSIIFSMSLGLALGINLITSYEKRKHDAETVVMQEKISTLQARIDGQVKPLAPP